MIAWNVFLFKGLHFSGRWCWSAKRFFCWSLGGCPPTVRKLFDRNDPVMIPPSNRLSAKQLGALLPSNTFQLVWFFQLITYLYYSSTGFCSLSNYVPIEVPWKLVKILCCSRWYIKTNIRERNEENKWWTDCYDHKLTASLILRNAKILCVLKKCRDLTWYTLCR